MDKYLPDELLSLKHYNALRVPIDYFDAAMDRLATEFLNVPIDTVLHPVPEQHTTKVEQAIDKAKAVPQPTPEEMTAEEYFERAKRRYHIDYHGKIRDYSEAIRLKSGLC